MKNRDTRSDLGAVREDHLEATTDGVDAGDANDGKDLESAKVTLKTEVDKYQALLDIHLMKSEKARHSVPPDSACTS